MGEDLSLRGHLQYLGTFLIVVSWWGEMGLGAATDISEEDRNVARYPISAWNSPS